MIILKLIRGLYKSLTGDGTAWQLALGFALGAFLGIVPTKAPDPESGLLGLNLTWFVALAVLIIVRCSFQAAVVSLAAFKLLAIACIDPLSFGFGRTLVEDLAPRGLIQGFYSSPVLAYFQLHTYWVAGSLVVGLAIAMAIYVASYVLVNKYRERIRKRLEQSKLMRALNRFWPFRFLRWVLVGGVSLTRG
ncbi:MAG: TIGR03546 family protein [Planctomycetota bacterium]